MLEKTHNRQMAETDTSSFLLKHLVLQGCTTTQKELALTVNFFFGTDVQTWLLWDDIKNSENHIMINGNLTNNTRQTLTEVFIPPLF